MVIQIKHKWLAILLLVNSSVHSQAITETKSGSDCLSIYEQYIKVESDSLLFISDPKQLPNYLNDYALDWKFKNLLRGCLARDEIISFRKAILDRVTSEEILGWIVKSTNKTYDKKYTPIGMEAEVAHSMYNTFPDIPFMEYSWRDLARIRLAEVIATRKKFRKE